ncbi:hypothetical protein DV737_g4286, partial [Chaetothyriales sp. CBS 132003]
MVSASVSPDIVRHHVTVSTISSIQRHQQKHSVKHSASHGAKHGANDSSNNSSNHGSNRGAQLPINKVECGGVEMSLIYSPTNTAAYNSFWGPVFLASRDITGQVPVNKVEYAGVNVQAACSPDNVFDSHQYQACLSNLLGAQFRWFTFDIYWDSTNRQFGLCPVQLPSQDDANSSTTTAAADASSGDGLIQLGPYQCSNDLTFDSVLGLFHDYISATSSKVLARLVLFEVNLHAAALQSQPQRPAPTPSDDQMPTASKRVGHLVDNANLQPFVYSFSQLLSDRSNLSATWYASDDPHRMQFTRYFNTTIANATTATANSTSPDYSYLSTQDGWPSEIHLLFSKLSRLLLTWGTIDDQMAAYDFASDSSTFFPRAYISTRRAFQANSTTGVLSSGCFYDDSTTSPSRVNVSWSLGYLDYTNDTTNNNNSLSTAALPNLLSNLTACGISPILNTSASGDTSAASDFDPYLDFTAASVMGWAPGEPQNTSSRPDALLDEPASQFRCAVLDSTSAYAGRWRVANCQQRFVAACRVDSYPYRWLLTSRAVTFRDAAAACQAAASEAAVSAVFDQPRTGLENTYLHHHIGCWVTTGANGTCDYADDLESEHDRQILIPTIGALLILFLALLTVLVKCNSNYRHNRRTKAGPGGWEYEGVPS